MFYAEFVLALESVIDELGDKKVSLVVQVCHCIHCNFMIYQKRYLVLKLLHYKLCRGILLPLLLNMQAIIKTSWMISYCLILRYTHFSNFPHTICIFCSMLYSKILLYILYRENPTIHLFFIHFHFGLRILMFLNYPYLFYGALSSYFVNVLAMVKLFNI